jgi:hypothetical protein
MRVAAVVGLLTATSAPLIWYSQEARQYALLLLLCTLSLILWAGIVVSREDRRIVWWALVSGLAFATHYFAALIVFPEAVVLLFRVPRTRRSVVAAAVLIAFVAAIVPLALYQRSTTNVAWVAATGSLLSRLRATEGLLLVNGGAGISHAWWLGRLFIIAALALVVWRGTAGERRAVATAVALALAVIALAVLVAVAGFDYVLPRHMLVVEAPLIAALAVALGSARVGTPGLVVAAAGAVLGVAVTLSVNGNLAYQREDVRDVARAFGAGTPDRVIALQRSADYLLADGGIPAFRYYDPSLRRLSGGVHTVEEVDVIDEEIAPAARNATLSRLARLGFRLRNYDKRQDFTIYQLVAPHAIAVSRGALLRGASFGGDDPILLVQ